MRSRSVLLLLVVVMLSACGSASTPTTAPTIAPTSTTAPTIAPTATTAPTIAPTSTTAPTIAPTSTTAPTIAPTSTTAPTIAPTSTTAPTIAPTSTTAPTVAPTLPPAPVAAVSDVRIVDIDAQGEIVLIRNVGTADQAMAGWVVQSSGSSACQLVEEQVFVFPGDFVLAAGAEVRLVSGPGAAAGPGVLAWTTQNIWSNERDRGELRDGSGRVVSALGYGSC